jgi:serine/threonine protein phosphatase PrpC
MRSSNQDSVLVKVVLTAQGRMVFAVLCDGVGGLEKGEVASATVVRAFEQWAITKLPQLSQMGLTEDTLYKDWEEVLEHANQMLAAYAGKQGTSLGTTVVAMLITERRYFVMNVGDSRAYELLNEARQITEDQTFVNREIQLGHLTRQQAKTDARRNILLQCVGLSETVYPELLSGDTQKDAVYLLCSDGFCHEISEDEIYARLQPAMLSQKPTVAGENANRQETFLSDKQTVNRQMQELIRMNRQRGEEDNITVAVIWIRQE